MLAVSLAPAVGTANVASAAGLGPGGQWPTGVSEVSRVTSTGLRVESEKPRRHEHGTWTQVDYRAHVRVRVTNRRLDRIIAIAAKTPTTTSAFSAPLFDPLERLRMQEHTVYRGHSVL